MGKCKGKQIIIINKQKKVQFKSHRNKKRLIVVGFAMTQVRWNEWRPIH